MKALLLLMLISSTAMSATYTRTEFTNIIEHEAENKEYRSSGTILLSSEHEFQLVDRYDNKHTFTSGTNLELLIVLLQQATALAERSTMDPYDDKAPELHVFTNSKYTIGARGRFVFYRIEGYAQTYLTHPQVTHLIDIIAQADATYSMLDSEEGTFPTGDGTRIIYLN